MEVDNVIKVTLTNEILKMISKIDETVIKRRGVQYKNAPSNSYRSWIKKRQ